MAGLDLKIKGTVGMIFILLATVFGWFLFGALSDILPDGYLKSIYWIGIILFWVSSAVITPILMIWGGKGNFKGAGLGLGVFFAGYVMSIILYYTIGYVLEALNGIYPNSTFVGIGWFAIYFLSVIGMVIVPTGLALKDAVRS